MTDIAIPAAGALIGGLIGGGQGAYIGWGIGSMFASSMQKTELPGRQVSVGRLTQAVFVQDSAYGRPIPRPWGLARLAGNVIWTAGIREHVRTETREVRVGSGKSESSYTETTTYYWYTCSFAVAICQGPIFAIRRIWADGKLIYNRAAWASDSEIAASAKLDEIMTVYTGTETQNPDPLMQSYCGNTSTPAYRGLAYAVFEDLHLADYGNRIPNLSFEIATDGHMNGDYVVPHTVSVSAMLDDLAQQAGISSNTDTSLVSGQSTGFMLAEQMSALDAVHAICTAYQLDIVESDKLKFHPTDSDSVVTIPEDDLVPRSDAAFDLLTVSRGEEAALPLRVEVSYLDAARDLQQSVQSTARVATPSKRTVKIELPAVMAATEARQLSEMALYVKWMNRLRFEFRTTLKYLAVEPGDVVTLQRGSDEFALKVTECDVAEDGIMQFQAVAHSAAAWNSVVAGSAGDYDVPVVPGPTPPPTDLFLIDTHCLSDNDDKPLFYVAAGSDDPDWRGAALYRSFDGGQTYSFVELMPLGVVGHTNNALPDGITTTWDEANYIDVSLERGALETITELAVLNWGNLAIVGDELVQFQNAELIDTNRYKLTRLLRGRKGTEWATGDHSSGERFVLLSAIGRVDMQVSEINIAYYYKGVSLGGSVEDASDQIFTYTGRNLYPLAPVNIWGDWSGNDVWINWTRRTRIGGEWRDYVDVPIGEAYERYEVEILNASNDVVRLLEVQDQTWVEYSEAMQIDDFGSAQSPGTIHVKIYQLSSLVGRGYEAEAYV